MLTTFQYRVKDASRGRCLEKWANAVNVVWNFCNNTQQHAVRWDRPWLRAFDLNNLCAGSSKEIGLHSQTIQGVCEQYAQSREQKKKRWLRYRSNKKNLGWIPFKASSIRQVGESLFRFGGKIFRVWYSRPLLGCIKTGSFVQDCLGRWYLNLTCEVPDACVSSGTAEVGIDLGLKTFATCSNGIKIDAAHCYRHAEEPLGKAQRAHKRRRVQKIARHVANKRKDFHHKISTTLVKENKVIVIGNVNSAQLAKTKMAKSVLDAGWSMFRTMLRYKAIAHRIRFLEVNERDTTQICSSCGAKPPERPRGIADLGIREWCCSACGTSHDRDVNAAKNILRLGRETLVEGIPHL